VTSAWCFLLTSKDDRQRLKRELFGAFGNDLARNNFKVRVDWETLSKLPVLSFLCRTVVAKMKLAVCVSVLNTCLLLIACDDSLDIGQCTSSPLKKLKTNNAECISYWMLQ